jgi:kynurenine 3-monooxygenase
MHRGERASYQQDFLDWGYKELTIPPCPDGAFRIDSTGLHIWPRGDSMLMAMPNFDGSFTCTFIYPFEGDQSFASLNGAEDVKAFFMSRFADVVPLVPNLEEDFVRNPIVEMITTRTSPWRFKDKVVLIGDSCHAVLPFYGQGMNAAFEDCRVLNACLDEFPDSWTEAFSAYQARRKPSTDILADLSKTNFVELRTKVRSPLFIARKKVDVIMNRLFPRLWFPLYTMISHMTIPITDAVRLSQRQNRVAKLFGLDLLLLIVALLIIMSDRFKRPAKSKPAPAHEPENFQPVMRSDLSPQTERASAAGVGSD